uniref:Uncharacterized protein n=1 Tax=Cyclophora tenuis TaxID=216820 RepID=A0A7S1CZD9_CYCTE|mmetsp:Transcript_13824/g.23545  ORF Transcript_13824/g.23545 Transcript_13824/m.23545 type:complete len:148 (+) Transcript_13824:89-532(+)
MIQCGGGNPEGITDEMQQAPPLQQLTNVGVGQTEEGDLNVSFSSSSESVGTTATESSLILLPTSIWRQTTSFLFCIQEIMMDVIGTSAECNLAKNAEVLEDPYAQYLVSPTGRSIPKGEKAESIANQRRRRRARRRKVVRKERDGLK